VFKSPKSSSCICVSTENRKQKISKMKRQSEFFCLCRYKSSLYIICKYVCVVGKCQTRQMLFGFSMVVLVCVEGRGGGMGRYRDRIYHGGLSSVVKTKVVK